MHRREFIKRFSAVAAASSLPGAWVWGASQPEALLSKTIPSSDEAIPVIGMGTWITFNVGNVPSLIDQRSRILKTFFERGGGMIDSSPMYGTAEAVVGRCLQKLEYPEGLFSATKVWTNSTEKGPGQVEDSLRLWGVKTLDLEQVHNLVNWREHLKTLRGLKEAGRIRYVGVTTSHGRRHAELARVLREESIDFVQLTYNMEATEAEKHLLDQAREQEVAVIANRPFGGGGLIDRVQRHPLPGFAAEMGLRHWPECLLKWIVSHPAVTCAIPATSKVEHMRENMQACRGRLLEDRERDKLQRYVMSL